MENVHQRFTTLISLKFIFSVIKMILLICIYFTYDENIFTGMTYETERNSNDYNKARQVYIIFNKILTLR